jgi:hypothetical protein
MDREITIGVEGITPLLLHNDNIDWADMMDDWKNDPKNKKLSKAGDDRSPAFRWIGCLYHDAEHVCMQADNLMKCLMEGGASVPTGKGQKTFKEYTQSGIIPLEAFYPIEGENGFVKYSEVWELQKETDFREHRTRVEELGFALSVKRAKVGQSKHIRVRPRFDSWSFEARLQIVDDTITPTVLDNILEAAGNKGLGDWRPSSKQSPGPYGRFIATVL